jgi:hypothetical protein
MREIGLMLKKSPNLIFFKKPSLCVANRFAQARKSIS